MTKTMTGDTPTSKPIQLRISKFIQAPRQRVFAAWTDPELMKQWFAPGEMTTPLAEVDLQPGGKYRIRMQNESGETMITYGEYQEIVENEKLVFSWGWDGPDRQESLVTVEFIDRDGGTEVTLTHTRLTNQEQAEHHQMGWNGCLENLAERIGRFS